MKKTYIAMLALILLISCRKEENAFPLIELSSPTENAGYDVFADIPVVGTAYDDNQLKSIKIQLLDKNLIPVLPAMQLNPEASTFSLNHAYNISDVHLKTGNYYLQVQVGDGTHTTNKYVSIMVNEAPRRFRFLLAVTRSGAQLNVVKIDSVYQTNIMLNLTSDYLGSGSSSDYAQFYICGSMNGNLQVYDVNSWETKWEVPVTINPPFPWFTGLMVDKGYCYVGYRQGRYEKYNPASTHLMSVNTATGWSPTKFCLLGDKLITEETSYTSQGRIMQVYYESTGAPFGDYLKDQKTVELIPVSNSEICHITNDIYGQAQLYIFNMTILNEWKPPSSFQPGKATCALKANSYVYIGHETGVYRFDESSTTLYQIIPGLNVRSMYFDNTNNLLYVAENKTIRQYYLPQTYPYGVLMNTIQLNDTILAVHAVFNKD